MKELSIREDKTTPSLLRDDNLTEVTQESQPKKGLTSTTSDPHKPAFSIFSREDEDELESLQQTTVHKHKMPEAGPATPSARSTSYHWDIFQNSVVGHIGLGAWTS